MKNNDIEKMLLNDDQYEKLVKKRIETDFENVLVKKDGLNTFIADIKKVPAGKLFSKNSTFEVINKLSKTKSYINGMQAEGYLGGQNSDRQRLLSGETDSFVCEHSFVKFVKLKV